MTRGAIARTVAIAIAVAAAIDPAVTVSRRVRPTVTVVADAGETANLDIGDRVARALQKTFIVTRTLVPESAALVVAGTRFPIVATDALIPTFAVLPNSRAPRVSIERLLAPRTATPDSRIPVAADIAVVHASGSTLIVTLAADGTLVDRAERHITSDDECASVTLSAVPMHEGSTVVRVVAELVAASSQHAADARANDHAMADALVNIERHPWRVLVFDRRPSWMSTFVRRALEQDDRFAIVEQTMTSTAAASSTPGAPTTLADARALVDFDAVVVGAPDALTTQDARGLDAFMRHRGGSVALLMDQQADGPYRALINVDRWDALTSVAALRLDVAGVSGEHVLASELAWPAVLPVASEPLLSLSRPGSPSVAVAWEQPVGAGRLLVSGALDAWRARNQDASSFGQFWRRALATLAAAAPPAVAVGVDRAVSGPSEGLTGQVRVRDVLLADVLPSTALRVSARLEPVPLLASSEVHSVRAWPVGAPGEFQIEARMPRVPGTYRLVVAAGSQEGAAPLVVLPGAAAPVPHGVDTLTAWATSHGGVAVPEERMGELITAIDASMHATTPLQTAHPMRSPWWIVPFASALGIEWWIRRRSGRA